MKKDEKCPHEIKKMVEVKKIQKHLTHIKLTKALIISN